MSEEHTPGPWEWNFLHEEGDDIGESDTMEELFSRTPLFQLDGPDRCVLRLEALQKARTDLYRCVARPLYATEQRGLLYALVREIDAVIAKAAIDAERK